MAKENRVKENTYVHIESWMVSELKLKSNALIIYAIIYGFSQDGTSQFSGGLQYLADWIGSSKNTVMNNLKTLVEHKLIEKIEIEQVNGLKLCNYKVRQEFVGYPKNLDGYPKNLVQYNNNTINNSNISKDILAQPEKDVSISEPKNDIGKDKGELFPVKKTTQKKKVNRKEDIATMFIMISNYTGNEEIRVLLKEYLNWRLSNTKGFKSSQWKIILDDLREYAKDDANLARQKIKSAIAGGYRQIVPDWEKGKQKVINKQASFDNTAGRVIPKGVADMNEQEKQDFYENELARDDNGELLVF